MNGNLEDSLYRNIDDNALFLNQGQMSWIKLDAEKIEICGEEFKKEDFNILKIIVNERRGNMYSLYRVYFIDRETLDFTIELVIGKTEISAVNTALQQSIFKDKKLDDLHYKFEIVTTFEKKKKIKDAIDTLKEALS